MTIIWFIIYAFIIGSTIQAVYNFRQYIKMRNLRISPKDKDQTAQNGILDKQVGSRNGNSFTPITDVLMNGNGKVHHGEAGVLNVSYCEALEHKSLIE